MLLNAKLIENLSKKYQVNINKQIIISHFIAKEWLRVNGTEVAEENWRDWKNENGTEWAWFFSKEKATWRVIITWQSPQYTEWLFISLSVTYRKKSRPVAVLTENEKKTQTEIASNCYPAKWFLCDWNVLLWAKIGVSFVFHLCVGGDHCSVFFFFG